MRMLGAVFVISFGLLAGCSGADKVRSVQAPESADRIVLVDGTVLNAAFLDASGLDVVVKLNRSAVATINGEPLPDPVVEGFAAPGFDIELLSGEKFTVGAGQPVTLIKFWATWCPYCRNDVEYIQALYDHYRGSGLRVLAVSLDRKKSDLPPFIEEFNITYPVAWLSQEDAQAMTKRYESRGVPGYYLVDAEGIVQAVYRGALVTRKTTAEDRLRRVLSGTGSALPERMPTAE